MAPPSFGWSQQNFFLAFRTSVWSQNKRGHLPWMRRHCPRWCLHNQNVVKQRFWKRSTLILLQMCSMCSFHDKISLITMPRYETEDLTFSGKLPSVEIVMESILLRREWPPISINLDFLTEPVSMAWRIWSCRCSDSTGFGFNPVTAWKWLNSARREKIEVVCRLLFLVSY